MDISTYFFKFNMQMDKHKNTFWKSLPVLYFVKKNIERF